MTCKICDNKSKYLFSMPNKYGEPRILDIFLCSYCGLLFVANPVKPKQLAHAYGTLDSDKYYQEIAINTDRKISTALQDLSLLLCNPADNPSVLDIGCGYGHFLDALNKSYSWVRTAGQELPGDSASTCQAQGFKVFTCALGDITDQFYIVVLLDVAEHVPWPNHTFATCYSLLKRDGYIYIHTPRRCFWDNFFLALIRIPGLGRLSRIWLRIRVGIFHLQLWTDKALKLSLEKAGFQLVYLKPKRELSWSLNRYVLVYLGEKYHFPPLLVRITAGLAKVIFIWLGTLRNKAVYLGQKRQPIRV